MSPGGSISSKFVGKDGRSKCPDYLTAFLMKTPPCVSLSGTFNSCTLSPEYNPSYLRSTHTGGAYLSINPEDLTERSHLQVVDRCLQLYTNSNLDAPTTFVNVLSLLQLNVIHPPNLFRDRHHSQPSYPISFVEDTSKSNHVPKWRLRNTGSRLATRSKVLCVQQYAARRCSRPSCEG